MATEIQQAISDLSNHDVRLADALRRLLVISRRIKADQLAASFRSELKGYGQDDELPEARRPKLAVTIQFDAPVRGFPPEHLKLHRLQLPDHLRPAFDGMKLHQPVAELEALASATGKSEPRLELPLFFVEEYRREAAAERVPGFSMMVATEAYFELPRHHLRGVVDQLRTNALELAIDLEVISVNAGEPDGPTIETEPELAGVAERYLNINAGDGVTVVIGDNATIATGDHATLIRLDRGDISGLLTAVGESISQDVASNLRLALDSDGGVPGEHTTGLLEKVRRGGYTLLGSMTASGAYDALTNMLSQVF